MSLPKELLDYQLGRVYLRLLENQVDRIRFGNQRKAKNIAHLSCYSWGKLR